MGIGGTGWMVNLIVFLIEEFNVNSIDVAQIYNVVNGCMNFLPVLAAIISDSFLGSFWVTSISSSIALMVINTVHRKLITRIIKSITTFEDKKHVWVVISLFILNFLCYHCREYFFYP